MLSAHEKMQIAAWKAETEAARNRTFGEDAPGWMRNAAYYFFSERERLLRKAEREGDMITAQIVHSQTLDALGEEERADLLQKSIDEHFERVWAA